MGNCCANESKAASQHEAKIRREQEREEAKRQTEEAIKSMASGGHQMFSSFTSPYNLTAHQGRNYFKFGWNQWRQSGTVPVTSFGVRVLAESSGGEPSARIQFLEGLANYCVFNCSWRPYEGDGSRPGGEKAQQQLVHITLDGYHSVDANTGEQTPVNTSPKQFLVDASSGSFVRVLNVEELVDEAVELAVAAAGETNSRAQKDELRRLLMQQRGVMSKGVVEDIALMWRCFVNAWTHEEVASGSEEEIWGTRCTRRKQIIQSDEAANKQQLEKFFDDLLTNMPNSPIQRAQINIEKAAQLQVYNGLFLTDSIRCHQSSYRKFTESTITIQGVTSTRAEFEGKRWIFGWSDIPELSSRAYMVSAFSEYANVGGAVHDAMSMRYQNADESVNMIQVLIQHPFTTEPNDTVVSADQTKQKIAGMIQLSQGAHSMFSGLSPPIDYPPKDHSQHYFTFLWPMHGVVRVCALGYTIKVVDDEVSFTQGLGTFIMFDVRWQPCSNYPQLGVPKGSLELFLEHNVLINAASGTEEPLNEPVKHLIISPDGELLRIVNLDELIDFAITSAIVQKGAIAEEEKQNYRAMLESTQKQTLERAVRADLNFIWASWVQLWTHQTTTSGTASVTFDLPTIELSAQHSSPVSTNRATVSQLIRSVLINSNSVDGSMSPTSAETKAMMEKEIQVDDARQEESYTTLFERDTVRPLIASYEKITSTTLSLHADGNNLPSPSNASSSSRTASSPSSSSSSSPLHVIRQTEFKNSRYAMLWSDIPQLRTKQYIQQVYQSYLDRANEEYHELINKTQQGRKS